MKKKLLSLLLALVMILGMIPAATMTASAETTATSSGLTGSGTESDPYVVGSENAIREAIANANGEHVFLKLEPTSGDTVHWSDVVLEFGSDVTIDMNGFDLKLEYERGMGNFGIRVLENATVTFCGKGEVLCGKSMIYGTLVVKDEVSLSALYNDGKTYYFAPKAPGKIIMYGGAINCVYISAGNEAGSFYMYDGAITKEVDGSYFASPGGDFNLFGGSITGERGSGFTYMLGDYDVDIKTKINGFLAYDSEGKISKIKNMGSFASYGKDRTYAEFAGAGIISDSPAIYKTGELVDLGHIKSGSYPIKFRSPKLTVGFINEGYYYYEELSVYDSSGSLVTSFGNTNNTSAGSEGISYDLNELSTGYYKIVETVFLKDKNGNTVFDPVSNIIYVDWEQSFALSGNISGVKDDTVTTVTVCKYGSTVPIRTAEVIGNGSYRFDELLWGNYTITATAEGYNDRGISRLISSDTVSNFAMTLMQISSVDVGAVFSGTPTDATTSTLNAQVTSTNWYKKNGTGWTALSASDTISEGNTYRCQITLGTLNGAVFADDYTVTIGGYAATKGTTANVWYLDRTITGYTDYIDIMDIDGPIVGKNPSFVTGSIQSSNTELYKIDWYKCDASGVKLSGALTSDYTYEAESYYRCEVTIIPSENWAFDIENLSFWLDGDAVQYYYPYYNLNGGVTGWKVYEVEYPIFANANMSAYGGAYGSGYYYKGETVTLTARPKTGYKFVKWLRDGQKVSTDATYSFTVTGSEKFVAVFASATPDVWVGGVGMTYGDYLAVGATAVSSTMPSNGCYAFYDDGVLSLRNYSYNGKGYEYSSGLYAVIYAQNEIGILLSSVNTLTQTITSNTGTVIQLNAGGTIRGSNVSGGSSGELTTSGGWMSIYASSGDITVNGGTLDISGCYYGIDAGDGNIIINDGVVNVRSAYYALKAYNNITVNFGNVLARCTNTSTANDSLYYAICAEGEFTFDRCSPTASTERTGNPPTYFVFQDLTTYDYVALEPLYKVSFIVDGDVFTNEYATEGETVTEPADPDVSGKRFLGWYTQTGYEFYFDEPITQDVSLYAEFGDPYQVTDVSFAVTAPVSGENPSFKITLPDGANYTHFIKAGFYKDEFWWDSTEGRGLGDTDTFLAGHRYIVSVYLKAKNGYVFPEDETEITASVDGVDSVILRSFDTRYLRVSFVLTAPNATVSGNVSNVENGSDIWVYLYEEGFTEPSYEGKADADGNYLITDVTPGNYIVKAMAAGYEDYATVTTVTVEDTLVYNIYMTKKMITGDVNGDGEIDIRDLVRLKKIIVNGTNLDYENPDVNGDTYIDTYDLVDLRKMLLNIL